MVPMLGILGTIFGGLKSNDIEEERAKLSDAEKVKKMKPAELLIAKGVLSMLDQQNSKASELFHESLRLAQEAEDYDQETLVLNLLATNYFESGDLEAAEKLFIDLIKRLMGQEAEPNSPAILELSLKLASIYGRDRRTHEKAMKGFKFVIDSLLLKLEDLLSSDEYNFKELSEERRNELALLGWSYDWFAKYLIEINDYRSAAEMFQMAYKISSKVLGPLHDQTLILLNDIGTTLAMNASPEEGRIYLKKAVEGAIANESKELASFYLNLGLVDIQLKHWNEAKRYCEYSFELSSKNREHPNSSEVIQLSRSCLSEVERALGSTG